MGDLAHALHLSWRSLSDQQELVIKGKPFDSLRVAELREELDARGIYDKTTAKMICKKCLLASFKEFDVFQL